MKRPAHSRRFLLTLVAMGAALPPILWGTKHSLESIYNSPPAWVPESFEQRRLYEQFTRQFEGDDPIIISWPGCSVDDARLARLEQELTAPGDPQARRRRAKLFERVLTGYTVVRELTQGPPDLSRSQATRRLAGSLVGPDGRTSCAIVVPTPYGAWKRGEAIDTLLEIARAVAPDVQRDEFYLAGPPVDGRAIDVESIRSLDYFAIPASVVALLICWVCLRSWRLTLAVVAVATWGELLMLAMVYYSGHAMNAVLIVLPSLVFVLTVCGGVHLVNYYYDQVRSSGHERAASRALAAGWLPCLLAAVTTAIGLGSLLVSDIVPIRVFSVISVLGVMTTVGILFLVLPGVMELWPVEPPGGRFAPAADSTAPDPPGMDGWRAALAAFVCRRAGWITSGSLLLMLLSAWGLRWVRTSVNVRALFTPDSRVMRDYTWMEKNLGPLIPVEVVLTFDRRECELDLMQRFELLRRVQHEIEEMERVGGVISATTFAPPIPRATWRRAVYRHRLRSSREYFIEANYLHEDDRRQSWRISARVSALADIDYGLFLGELESRIKPLLEGYRARGIRGVRTVCTGVMPLVDEAQRALLHDLFASFLTAFVVVALVMVLVLRSLPAGMLAMLPNVFPTLILFGAMGWLKTPVDIGSVMTASVALGIAVDGTLHFLTWYRRETAGGAPPDEAVHRCYRHCGQALVQATVICGLGLLVFILSEFVPTKRFVRMMLLLLVAALVGDLLLLPALLVGPAGRVFLRRPQGS